MFTDIEGSSRLWEQDPVGMRAAMARHDAIAKAAVGRTKGRIVKMLGDGIHAVFEDPLEAVNATVEMLGLLADPASTNGIELKVRCGLHAGVEEIRDGEFLGRSVNRAARIMSVAHGGQALASQAVAELIENRLSGGLNLRDLGHVRLRDLASPERVYQIEHSSLRTTFPALRSLDGTPNNLPQPVTSFIGRERELRELGELLAKRRLLTLHGPGGTGKTRLSLHLAAERMGQFPDGVWFVELAALTDRQLVPRAVAAVLGVREGAGQSVTDALCNHLAARRALLVLDNCEHLVAACAELSFRLLRATKELRIVATGREVLGCEGEQTYHVASLSVPGSADAPDRVMRSEAAQLLIDRIRLQVAGWTPSPHEIRAISQVCVRLDGLPLALELVAVRMATLPIEQLAERLDHRFSLLTTGSRTAPGRQRTLRALIDWSYELLSGTEKTLLTRVSVFRNGWTSDAAMAIASGAIPAADVGDALDNLIRKSLVTVERDSGRYRMLETIREYAAERLTEGGTNDEVSLLHLRFFAHLVEASALSLRGGPDQPAWHTRLEADHDNLRAALDYATDHDETVAVAATMCAVLYRFWVERGYFAEGFQRCQHVLSRGKQSLHTPLLARLTLATASLAMGFHGAAGSAERFLQDALDLAETVQDEDSIAAASHNLAMCMVMRRDPSTAAMDLIQRALTINRARGNRPWELNNIVWLGRYHAERGEDEHAVLAWNDARRLSRDLDYRARSLQIAAALGRMALRGKDLGKARTLVEEALALAEEGVGPSQQTDALIASAEVAIASERFFDALKFCARALRLQQPGAAYPGMAEAASVFEELAILAALGGKAAMGARLWGAADRVREPAALPYSWAQSERLPAQRAKCREMLSTAVWEPEYVRGRAMSFEEAVHAASELADQLLTTEREESS